MSGKKECSHPSSLKKPICCILGHRWDMKPSFKGDTPFVRPIRQYTCTRCGEKRDLDAMPLHANCRDRIKESSEKSNDNLGRNH